MQRWKHKNRGVVLVEMAIVLPVFILMLIGTIEFGLILHDYLILQNASREGARFGAIGSTQTAVVQRVKDFALQLNNSKLVVSVTNAQGVRGSTLTVTATYPVPVLTPLIQQITKTTTLSLKGTSLMRLE